MLLSQTQKRVMAWVGKGQLARSENGETVTIDGNTTCKLETMMTLLRLGLVQTDSDGNWTATDSGMVIARQFRL